MTGQDLNSTLKLLSIASSFFFRNVAFAIGLYNSLYNFPSNQKVLEKICLFQIGILHLSIKTNQLLTNMLFADKLKGLKEGKQLLQRQFASALEIETPMYNRIEKGERKAQREQVVLLAKFLDANEKELLLLWFADKVYNVLAEEDCADGVIKMITENIREYGK